MANNLVLSKESSESEIKRYFNAVLKLSKSDNEFPINLDEVWTLVYNRRDYAVDALKKDFIDGVDYVSTSVKTEVGSIRYEYKITVPCMEFFIARKVRPVFEVYRQVFHRAANKDLPGDEQLKLRDRILWVKEVKGLLNLNDVSTLGLLQKVAAPLGLPMPDYVPSKGILKSATELLKEHGYAISAQMFNQKAMAAGFLCEQYRLSSSGKKKPFKSITEKGKPYGENQVNPNNPKSTQPLWYADKFDELMGMIEPGERRGAV